MERAHVNCGTDVDISGCAKALSSCLRICGHPKIHKGRGTRERYLMNGKQKVLLCKNENSVDKPRKFNIRRYPECRFNTVT